MKLVEVTPISQKVAKETLSYFSSKDVLPGDIVAVEIRKKTYDALVLDVQEASGVKGDIKRSAFGFKKILSIKGRLPVYGSFFKAALETKEFFIGNFGTVLNTLLPDVFLENFEMKRVR